MKSAFLLLFSICAINSFAQFEDLNKRKPWEDYKKKYNYKNTPGLKSLPEAIEVPEPEQPTGGVLKIPLKRKFLGNTPKGDRVYAMQPDNMPCLVPRSSFKSNMPVARKKKDLRLNDEEQPSNEN